MNKNVIMHFAQQILIRLGLQTLWLKSLNIGVAQIPWKPDPVSSFKKQPDRDSRELISRFNESIAYKSTRVIIP